MTDAQSGRADLTSFSQFVQEVINGALRRHTFSQWELTLLLDLQTCAVRKSALPDLLRRYLKAVHRDFAAGASVPLRLSLFVERRRESRPASSSLHQPRAHAVRAARAR
ncbi:MAG: hypothetical protein JO340_09945 [Acidobacteriaceae bacterium]|nr:hypothetical protein [Acidobacteriaceae bacterium]